MKVIKASINWYKGYSNHPELQLLVDKIPALSELTYKKLYLEAQKGTFYWAEKEGYVHFLWSDPGNPRGYSGHTFACKLEDGTIDKVHGPWSSRAGCANCFFPHVTDVVLTEDSKAFVKGYTFQRGAVLLALAEEALELTGSGLKFEKVEDSDITYRIPKPEEYIKGPPRG